tara:strand:- start:2298 stop:3215 length:918 start_codon:yes stop_codon:yes gene_type:complete
MALNIIFMGTPEFSVPSLKSIINSGHKIIRVYTQPPKKKSRGQKIHKSPVHLVADTAGIEVKYPNFLSDDDYNYFLRSKPDLVVVVAYGKLIPKKFLDLPNLLFINLHASLLPKWRGAAPIERALLNLDKETGVSIMKITHGLDEGPYMKQIKVKIDKKTNAGELTTKLSSLGAQAVIDSLKIIYLKNARFVSQDETKSTYAKKIEKSETKIDWSKEAKDILGKINAFNPKPGAWFEYKSKRIKVLEADEVIKQGRAGEVLDNSLTVATGKNSIKILKLQKEGKNIVKAENFLVGNDIKKGSDLN